MQRPWRAVCYKRFQCKRTVDEVKAALKGRPSRQNTPLINDSSEQPEVNVQHLAVGGWWRSKKEYYFTSLCYREKVYLLHSEGPDDVFWEELGLDQRHLDVSVDLSVVRPVLAAFHLKANTKNNKSISSWHAFTFAHTQCFISLYTLIKCECLQLSRPLFFPILSHDITSHLQPGNSVSKSCLWSQNEIYFVLLSTPHQGSAVNGNLTYRRGTHSHIIAFSFSHWWCGDES